MSRNFVEAIVIANKQEVINPIGVALTPWKVFYERCDEDIGTICGLVDGFKIAFNIATTQSV